MRVLVVGCDGSAGRRYMMILKGMGVPHVGYDICQEPKINSTDCDRAIICTPTKTHADVLEDILLNHPGIRHVLCEKPLAHTVEDAITMAKAADIAGVRLHTVCNWRFFMPKLLEHASHHIYYRSPSFGNEDAWMNCCQPVHYAKDYKPDLALSDLWDLIIDDTPIQYQHVCESYRKMIRDWLDGGTYCMGGIESISMVMEAQSWGEQTGLQS